LILHIVKHFYEQIVKLAKLFYKITKLHCVSVKSSPFYRAASMS